MYLSRSRLIALPVLLVSSSTLMWASGTLRGKVADKLSGEPLTGANVFIVGTLLGGTTNSSGEYTIINVPVGVHVLRASFVGYTPTINENVFVHNDLTTESDFQLPPEDVSVEAITVVAERPLVNKSATNALRIMTSADINAIPVRGLDNLLALNSGVVLQDGNIYIRGGRVDETGYYLEGVSIADPQMGGRGLTINQNALEEISVRSGGYEAEYGRANAGIIQHQLKSGGSDIYASLEYITDNLSLYPSSSWSQGRTRLGSYWFGYNDLTATLSGPVLEKNVKFFALYSYGYEADRHPSYYPGITIGPVKDKTLSDSINFIYPAGILLKNSEEHHTGTATAQLDFYPLFLRMSGSYTATKSFEGGSPRYFLDLDRIPQFNESDGFISLKATYFLNSKSFVEVSGGYFGYASRLLDPVLKDDFLSYGDSLDNALAGFVWTRKDGETTGRYTVPRPLAIFDFSFPAPGVPVSGYERFKRVNISMTGSLSVQVDDAHTLKMGGDYQRYTIRTFRVPFPNNLALQMANPGGRTPEQIMISTGVENYGFDVLGNQIEKDDFEGPRYPIFASAYAQDRVEFTDLTVSLGLRYDYVNTNTYIPVDPSHLELYVVKKFRTLFDLMIWMVRVVVLVSCLLDCNAFVA